VSPPEEELKRIRAESRKVSRIFAEVSKHRYWNGPFLRPVPGEAISSFGKRSIINGQPRSPHTGTDFRAAEGTPVKAPAAGRVMLVQDLYFAGNTVIVDHGLGLYSYFAHLSSFSVTEGQFIEAGEIVGEVGATGRVTGPHLHWTLRLAEARVDPLSLMEALEEK
jgi:murein DD-endopeptidase MepM/ murein hydrolase activator NlpD